MAFDWGVLEPGTGSQVLLDFASPRTASEWFDARVDQAVETGWTLQKPDPKASHLIHAFLKGPDGAYLGISREDYLALEIIGTNRSKVYSLMFDVQGLCCVWNNGKID